VPALELAKQAALQLRTVVLGVEYGDRKRSRRHALNTRMNLYFDPV